MLFGINVWKSSLAADGYCFVNEFSSMGLYWERG